MCLICLDLDRGIMTVPEAVRAFSESVKDGHSKEVKQKIKDKAVEEVAEMYKKLRKP